MRSKESGPTAGPRLLIWLATRRVPSAEREFAEGDLAEEYAHRADRNGRRAAGRWLVRHAWRGLRGSDLERRPAATPPAAVPGGGSLSGLSLDLGFALRLMRRTPLLSAAAVLTFALGLGANVAVFSVAWPALGQRLAIPDEERLTFIMLSVPGPNGAASNPISPGDFVDLRETRSFEKMAAFNIFPSELNLTGAREPVRVRVGRVTEDFFATLGVPALLGRPIDARDFAGGSPPLVLHEHAWRRDFGADRSIVGKAVRLDGAAWTVVGVMPEAAAVGTLEVDGWSVQPVDPATARQQRSYFLAMVGRLRRGVTLEAANRDLAAVMLVAADRYPASNALANGSPLLARAESFRERLTGPMRPVFLLLIGGAGLVLLVAAVNLAGLQLSRQLARRQELAMRRALGAGRGRLVRQLTLEGLVTGVAGGVVGLMAATLTLNGLAQIAPALGWFKVSPRLTPTIAVFTFGLTVIVGILVGLVPALAASGATMPNATAARGMTASLGATRIRTTAVGAQVAIVVILLITATLAAASLTRVLRVDPGFEVTHGLIADLRPSGDQGEVMRFFDALLPQAEALPGVERACATNHVPLDNDGGGMTFVAEGRTDSDRRTALPMGVSAGCFDALRIPLVRGRLFNEAETESVVIVSESMANALWPDGADPVGKRLHLGLVSGPLYEVAGVVRDIRAASLESSFTRQVWMSTSRGWPWPQRLIIRTNGPPATLARSLRALVASMDPELALADIRTMSDIVSDATASRRFVLVLVAAFAAISLGLCAIGIYGLLAHQVGERTREIGIRLALGATGAAVIRTIAAHMSIGVGGGLLAGLAGAWALSSVLAGQLFEVSATDGRVYAAVAVFVALVAAAACWPPTRRATRVDPVVALRAE